MQGTFNFEEMSKGRKTKPTSSDIKSQNKKRRQLRAAMRKSSWEEERARTDVPKESPQWRSCGSKKRFGTENQARAAASRGEGLYGRRLGVYLCPICSGWHLTHKVDQ